ncbi:hypothetical protein TRFO_16464 [Tritrichomonas foetus]|uniref:Leucine Rich Repeat family protein n=1 Tax=Tritrichomonas foetus TaxID=1144522 RepID=A0A1J4KUN6_9EUKA|nr:hypothetical protein TRFO_16464 [Tritrichomonas foetus]|eukprot:OHT13374.1 hypothetical protein TRFO_16464 [Tritrichomonas foetus]
MSEKQAASFARKQSMLVLYCDHVTNVATKVLGRNKKELLLITDQILVFFDSKKKTPYYWITVSSVKLTDKQIELQFQLSKNEYKNINFIPQKSDLKSVFGIIIDLLNRILPADKIEALELKQYNNHKIPISGFAALARFLGYCAVKEISGRENIQPFKMLTMVKNPIFSLSNFPSPNDVFPAVLDVLQFLSHVSSLHICQTNNVFDTLSKKITSLENLNNLIIDSSSKSKFQNFLDKLGQLESDIEGITLSSVNLNSDELNDLCEIIKQKNFSSLGFNQNSLSSEAISSLSDNLSTLSNNLMFLSLNYIPNIKLSNLSSNISYVTILSLVGCNLQIGNALNFIFKNGFSKLSELDLSGNICTSPIETKGKFPSKLSKLIVNGIDWNNSDNFISFLDCVFKKMNVLLKLSVAYSSLLGLKDWGNVFKFLSRLKMDLSPIISLCWDNNPVNSLFFNFLEQCTQLKTLSISSYFNSEDQADQISSLCEYLSGAKRIETLILKGSQQATMKNRISDVFKAASKMKSLRKLDVSFNEIGDHGINSLVNLLNRNPISVVALDGSCPSSLEIIKELFNDSPSNCKLNFPISDVYNLYDANTNKKESKSITDGNKDIKTSTSSVMSDIKEIIKLSSTKMLGKRNNSQNKNGKVPLPTSNPLDDPFYVFYDWDISPVISLPTFVKRSSYSPMSLKSPKRRDMLDESDDDDDDEVFESDDNEKKKNRNKNNQKSPRKKRNSDSDSDSESEDSDNVRNKKNKKNDKKRNISDSDDDFRNKKKKSDKRKSHLNSDNDDDEFSMRTKAGKKRSSSPKRKDKTDSDDDYLPKKHGKGSDRRRKRSNSDFDNSDTNSDSDSNNGGNQKRKRPNDRTHIYEMTTVKSTARKEVSSLTNSEFSMRTKGNKKRAESPLSQDPRNKSMRRLQAPGLKRGKLDSSDSHSYSDSDEEDHNYKQVKRNQSKRINRNRQLDDSENDDEIVIDKQFIQRKSSPKLQPVKQKPPPSLGGSEDERNSPIKKRGVNLTHQNMKNGDESDSFDGHLNENDDDDDFAPPRPADWSFPLYYVPAPTDTDQIIQDLNEKYSVGALLTYMSNA